MIMIMIIHHSRPSLGFVVFCSPLYREYLRSPRLGSLLPTLFTSLHITHLHFFTILFLSVFHLSFFLSFFVFVGTTFVNVDFMFTTQNYSFTGVRIVGATFVNNKSCRLDTSQAAISNVGGKSHQFLGGKKRVVFIFLFIFIFFFSVSSSHPFIFTQAPSSTSALSMPRSPTVAASIKTSLQTSRPWAPSSRSSRTGEMLPISEMQASHTGTSTPTTTWASTSPSSR